MTVPCVHKDKDCCWQVDSTGGQIWGCVSAWFPWQPLGMETVCSMPLLLVRFCFFHLLLFISSFFKFLSSTHHNTHTHTQTHTHTHTLTGTHTDMHAHTHTRTHIRTHAHTYARMHTHTHTLTYTHTHTHTHMPTHILYCLLFEDNCYRIYQRKENHALWLEKAGANWSTQIGALL